MINWSLGLIWEANEPVLVTFNSSLKQLAFTLSFSTSIIAPVKSLAIPSPAFISIIGSFLWYNIKKILSSVYPWSFNIQYTWSAWAGNPSESTELCGKLGSIGLVTFTAIQWSTFTSSKNTSSLWVIVPFTANTSWSWVIRLLVALLQTPETLINSHCPAVVSLPSDQSVLTTPNGLSHRNPTRAPGKPTEVGIFNHAERL